MLLIRRCGAGHYRDEWADVSEDAARRTGFYDGDVSALRYGRRHIFYAAAILANMRPIR